ncbi:MAG: hypothetical protein WCP79_15215, partial [Bacillota bacterium]
TCVTRIVTDKSVRQDMLRVEIQRAMSLKSKDHFRKAYLEPALSSGLIEMTKPESPNSPVQKYRLTQQGEALRKYLSFVSNNINYR